MKQTKRILAMLLSLCLVLGMLPGIASAASSSQFTDVNTWDWYYDAVRYVSSQGLMNGTSATTFEPNTTTTRGMIVTILYRMEGSPSYANKSYTDVPANEWYAPAVAWANTYSIVKGYGDGTFGPNDPITREQLALVLFRYAQLKKYNTSMTGDLTKYTDKAQISSYDAQIALSWALGKGVLTAADSGLLEPKTEATRALAAYALKGFADNVVGTGAAGLVPSNWTSTSTPQPAASADKAAETETYTVTFYLNYGRGNQVYKEVTVPAGNKVERPGMPHRERYIFEGWYESSTGRGRAFNFNTAINSDVSLYAQWEYDNHYNYQWRYWDQDHATWQYVSDYWYEDDYYWSDYYYWWQYQYEDIDQWIKNVIDKIWGEHNWQYNDGSGWRYKKDNTTWEYWQNSDYNYELDNKRLADGEYHWFRILKTDETDVDYFDFTSNKWVPVLP